MMWFGAITPDLYSTVLWSNNTLSAPGIYTLSYPGVYAALS